MLNYHLAPSDISVDLRVNSSIAERKLFTIGMTPDSFLKEIGRRSFHEVHGKCIKKLCFKISLHQNELVLKNFATFFPWTL